MSNFRVGQKVVCVDPVDELVKGKVYTIFLISDGMLHLGELDHYRDWYFYRFRPAVDIKEDIALFHALCPGLPVVPPAVVPPRERHTLASD